MYWLKEIEDDEMFVGEKEMITSPYKYKVGDMVKIPFINTNSDDNVEAEIIDISREAETIFYSVEFEGFFLMPFENEIGATVSMDEIIDPEGNEVLAKVLNVEDDDGITWTTVRSEGWRFSEEALDELNPDEE
jgi:hypothetical protein